MPEYNQNDAYVRIQGHYIACPLLTSGLSALETEALKTKPYRQRLEQAIEANGCFHPINNCPGTFTEEDEKYLLEQHILIPKD